MDRGARGGVGVRLHNRDETRRDERKFFLTRLGRLAGLEALDLALLEHRPQSLKSVVDLAEDFCGPALVRVHREAPALVEGLHLGELLIDIRAPVEDVHARDANGIQQVLHRLPLPHSCVLRQTSLSSARSVS